MKNLRERIAETWCYYIHPAPMRPVKGKYRCPRCLREYPVPWEQNDRLVSREHEISALRVVEIPKRSAA